MPIPTTRTELLAAVQERFAKLDAALDDVPPDMADEPSMDGHAKARIRAVIEVEQKEWNEVCKEQPWRLSQVYAALGRLEYAFVVTAKPKLDQEIMQHFERRELVFVDDFADLEHLFGTASRPIEVRYSPMHEDAFEGLGLGQPYAAILLGIGQRQHCRAEQGRVRVREVRVVIRQGTELDHATTLAQRLLQRQTPSFTGRPRPENRFHRRDRNGQTLHLLRPNLHLCCFYSRRKFAICSQKFTDADQCRHPQSLKITE